MRASTTRLWWPPSFAPLVIGLWSPWPLHRPPCDQLEVVEGSIGPHRLTSGGGDGGSNGHGSLDATGQEATDLTTVGGALGAAGLASTSSSPPRGSSMAAQGSISSSSSLSLALLLLHVLL
ncbi:hypothetical protein SETIT_1G222000v2 [Setaria italica]|uniref:Uncharacterized protein n=1 Tax=Setaria italica TaxID=4555 RepID=A0A368PMZ2_SETIT|nr:hypothetical protein SETIT_1G222000v2 [Setaria italica]